MSGAYSDFIPSPTAVDVALGDHRRSLKCSPHVDSKKAVGADGIPGRVQKGKS